jgi:hypothetical protein
MERTAGGRIEKVRNGSTWTSTLPAGRDFNKTGKNSGDWFITEKGCKLRDLLTRYADGEPLAALARECGFASSQAITRNVRESQLSGTYYAKFNSPEIGIDNLLIAVPGVPEVISPELEKRVRDRMAHNKQWNKRSKKKYLLAGFLRCAHCGRSLKGQTTKSGSYYRHDSYYVDGRIHCPYSGIRGDLLESQVLDYCYRFFLDEPAYRKAIKCALPSGDDRKALEADLGQVRRQLAGVSKKISNLGDAFAKGADVSLFLDKQNELKAEKQALASRRDELSQTLANMPDPEYIELEAMFIRQSLEMEHMHKDWRKTPYDDVRRFLHFLFSDNPRKAGFGICLGWIDGAWEITFKGCVAFYHDVIDGRPISHRFQLEVALANAELMENVQRSFREIAGKHKDKAGCSTNLLGKQREKWSVVSVS